MSSKEEAKLMDGPKNFYFLNKAPKEKDGENAVELDISPEARPEEHEQGGVFSFITGLFRPRGYQSISAAKTRKVPTKIEPKVFFANERTFLAWLHMSVTLSSISVAIIAFAEANEWSQMYGLMLMPVAIAFCCYSLYMYMKRAAMIRQRHPGPCK
jgi:uncharacterized membrane protein YidH (DUF202 family)